MATARLLAVFVALLLLILGACAGVSRRPTPTPRPTTTFAKRPSTKSARDDTAEPHHDPNGRIFTRIPHAKENRLLSGEPDSWFARVLRKEPEDLTLDEVEDMTPDERSDYVGLFAWDHRPPGYNVVEHLLRLEQLGRMYHRRRPEEMDPKDMHDHPDAPVAGESRPAHLGDPEVPPEDRRMSSPRWHLKDEKERIENDHVWRRRTKRRRPKVAPRDVAPVTIKEAMADTADGSATAEAGGTRPKKKTAIIHKEPEKADGAYDPKFTTSTMRLRATVDRMSPEERLQHRLRLSRLPENERVEELVKEDSGRCIAAASHFCQGLTYHWAEFVDCMLDNTDKFEDHDAHCVKEVPFFAPCRRDMLRHCPERDSFSVIKCMVELAGADADALLESGAAVKDVATAEGRRVLSDECLASEYMHAMVLDRPHERTNDEHTLSEEQRKMLFKYQQFWLTQHDDPNTTEDDGIDPRAHIDQFHVVTEDEL